MLCETINARGDVRRCSKKLYIILWVFSGRVGVWHFSSKWTWNFVAQLNKTQADENYSYGVLCFTWRLLYSLLHWHWIMHKSNSTQSQKVTFFSLNFISPKSRILHLIWLSGLLYDSGDNGESGGSSRKWFICSISDTYLRRTWIMPWDHVFLLELDNEPRWRRLCYNCLRPSKTNPAEGTQINAMSTLAMAHLQKPLALQLQHPCLQSQLGLCFPSHWWLSFLTFPCRF